MVQNRWAKTNPTALLMKWILLKWLPVISFGIVIFCQMTWVYFDSPGLYYKGLSLCLLGLIYSQYYHHNKGTVIKAIYSFILGLCVWNLVEELFFDPTKFDAPEYWGFFAGFIFLTRELWKKSKN